jgi:hypothetical protein
MIGKALLGTNYTLSETYGQVTIPAGASSASVTLTALPNSFTRGVKPATMKLRSGTAYNLGQPSSATIAIMNSP